MNGHDSCPCGRGERYDSCCGPLHAGAAAPTAERLMRSRFSAFALGLSDYLRDTWAVATRPAALDLIEPGVEWKRLFIEETVAGGPFDREGFVSFTAIGRTADGRFEQRERSRFARDAQDRWCYVDGEVAAGEAH